MPKNHSDIFSLLIFTVYNITQTNLSHFINIKKYNLPNVLMPRLEKNDTSFIFVPHIPANLVYTLK
jgi:hypothetical protein